MRKMFITAVLLATLWALIPEEAYSCGFGRRGPVRRFIARVSMARGW